MTYGWIITTDHLGDGEDGIMGPRDITPAHADALRRGEGLTFRLLDDDGELYYTGRIVGLGDKADDLTEEAFAPLEDFGTPNAGAVRIEYRSPSGTWEAI